MKDHSLAKPGPFSCNNFPDSGPRTRVIDNSQIHQYYSFRWKRAFMFPIPESGIMELKLLHDVCGADCTLGQLNVDGKFECYTVEDVVRPADDKINGKTAIPEGCYQVIVTPSPRFRRDLPLLLRCRISKACGSTQGTRLKARNAASCPAAPGTRRATQSRPAFDALFTRLAAALANGGKVWIDVATPGNTAQPVGPFGASG